MGVGRRCDRMGQRGPAMSSNPFIKDLTADEYDLLARLFMPFDATARTTLIKQGEPAAYLFLVLSGSVVLRYKPYDGPRITLTHLHEGGIFGWSAVIGNDIYTSDAISTTPVRTLRLRGGDLKQLCIEHPIEGGRILEKLARAVSPRWVHARKQIQVLLREYLQPA